MKKRALVLVIAVSGMLALMAGGSLAYAAVSGGRIGTPPSTQTDQGGQSENEQAGDNEPGDTGGAAEQGQSGPSEQGDVQSGPGHNDPGGADHQFEGQE